MKRQFCWFLILAFSTLWGAVLASPKLDGRQIPKVFDKRDLKQLVLIGFADSNINRQAFATSADSYRRRGQYQGSTWSKRVVSQISNDYDLEMLTDWPMTEIGIHCVVLRVPESDSVEHVLKNLSSDERIGIAQKMHVFKVEADHYRNDPYYTWQSNLRLMRIAEVHARTIGRDVSIGIVDTGVDTTHPDLEGQIVFTKNFAESVSPHFSNDAHGTAVAGVISARPNNNAGIVGIAPGARLSAFKACWPMQADDMKAICNSFTLALAVNSAIRAKVNILNMSLAGPVDPILTMLLDKAAENGIITVAADAGMISGAKSFPASLSSVIGVRSSRGSQESTVQLDPSVVAPGTNILTTLPRGNYDYVSGSSLAAAQISGIVALMLQLDPKISQQKIRAILQDNKSLDICKMLCNKEIAVADAAAVPF